MKNLMKNGSVPRFTITMICNVMLTFLFGSVNSFAGSFALSAATREELRPGERIYREGILRSGEKLRVSIKEGIVAPGMTFACVSCHLRSGLGSFDEGVSTPSINGDTLFKPLAWRYKGMEQSANASKPPLRPAYTEETLIRAIRSGIDPNGRVLSEVMPRYPLEDNDARVLVAYLRSLSSQFSPGVTDTLIRFATVISEDARPDLREAMVASINAYVTNKNNQTKYFTNPRGARSRQMAENMLGSRELATKSIALSTWVLKGPSSTWRAQLAEYDRKEPVFALLGGIVSGDWQPIHQFCEEQGIPSLFPNTDFPVISVTDWYTLYLSKGYYQEGEGAARYLSSREEIFKGRSVVQIVRASREADALSKGFEQTWQDLGHQMPVTIPLPSGKGLNNELLQQVLARHHPAALIIWDDAAALPALELLVRHVDRPDMILLSARYLGDSMWSMKEPVRDFTYLTYPFSFSPYIARAGAGMTARQVPEDPKRTLKQAEVPIKDEAQKIVSLSNAMTAVLTSLLMDLQGNYYRDHMLDVAGMLTDQQYPLYGPISFSTGRRYASRGCFIVQLSRGDNPELVKKSGWIVD